MKEAKNEEKRCASRIQVIVKDKLPESLVRQCLSEAKSEDQMRQRDPEAEQIENRSAYFTDLLKRQLRERDKDLTEPLKKD